MVVLLLAVAVPESPAAPKWIKVSSANFVLYTPAKPKAALSKIAQFESLSDFFRRAMKLKRPPDEPVYLVGFRNLRELAPYRPVPEIEAFYLNTGWRRLIVLGSMGPDAGETAVHEFVHLVIDRSGMRIPRWLNEGMAEFYSTISARKNKAVIGKVPRGRLISLKQSRWISLETLLDPAHEARIFSHWDRGGMFYAESWLLTHMLIMSPKYRDKFPRFAEKLHGGAGAALAFREVYGLSLKEVNSDFLRYLNGPLYTATLSLELRPAFTKPVLEPADPVEVESILVVLAENARRQPEAEQRLSRLKSMYGARAEVNELLGFRALRDGRFEEAAEYFARAVEAGSRTARVYLEYAGLLDRMGAPLEEQIELLEKMLEIAPGSREGRLRLGLVLTSARRYHEAYRELVRVGTVRPREAAAYFTALALSCHGLGNRTEAERAARRALEHARTRAERRTAQDVLDFVTGSLQPPPGGLPHRAQVTAAAPARSHGSQRETTPQGIEEPVSAAPANRAPAAPGPRVQVRGALEEVDCRGAVARIRLDVGGEKLWLGIYDSRKVIVRGAGSSQVALTCGEQNPAPVRVLFRSGVDPELDTVGRVLLIEFLDVE